MTEYQIREGKKVYSCPTCGKNIKTKSYLKSHMERAHNENRLKETVHEKVDNSCLCPICGKNMCDVTYLKEHIARVHEGNKDHATQCPMCGKNVSININ